jgi:2',3'-cyclic-nucleotide 2'-phosphodiesterase/3'-nucleotidase/5'-nucleotidase
MADRAHAADCMPFLCDSDAAPMMKTFHGWTIDPVFTVGEDLKGYTPPGILDGIGAIQRGPEIVTLLVNHELGKTDGNAYTLANGTTLTGGRVTAFNVGRKLRKIRSADLAFDTIYDRQGMIVTSAAQVNEAGSPTDGLDRLCSSAAFPAGSYGFEDNIYFTNEETSEAGGHPHGGTVWALDVNRKNLWAVPALGRGAWENVTAIAAPGDDKVALALGDDYGGTSTLITTGATYTGVPLYLWIGEKNPDPRARFLARDGLTDGQLYYFKAADSCEATPTAHSPEDFKGTGSALGGVFCPIAVKDAARAGQPGYDAQGYLNAETLRGTALSEGALAFSRPEDVQVNPNRANQFAFISTGRGKNFASDDWGNVYVVTTRLNTLKGEVRIVYDGDDAGGGQFPEPDYGVRSPDNVTWGHDRFLYVQEDPATQLNAFGETSGRDSSIWQINPVTGTARRIAEADRSAVSPPDATNDPAELWESSGILDVSTLFPTRPGETLLVADVQAHGIVDGTIAAENLVEGGQLFFLSKIRPQAR